MKHAMYGILSLLPLLSMTSVWAGDQEDVAAAMNMWKDNLAVGTAEDTSKILSLYAQDGILWGVRRQSISDFW